MDYFQFLISFFWIFLAAIVIGFSFYLILSGRLRWLEYQTGIGMLTVKVTTDLGIKGVSPDEIIIFERFIYQDLSKLERGVKLAYVLLFLERELIEAKFVENSLEIKLSEKGKKLHDTIINAYEKWLMIRPETDIVWKIDKEESNHLSHSSLIKNHCIRDLL